MTLVDPVVDANGGWVDPHVGISIAGSASTVITATVTIPAGYAGVTFDNTAQVTVGGELVDEASVSLYLPNNGLTLTKTANPLSVSPGDTITYTFVVDNLSGAPIDNVTLSDPVVDANGSYLIRW